MEKPREKTQKELREIGERYLKFWGACLRERESGNAVYAQWSAYHEQFKDQSIAEIVKYCLKGHKIKQDDPPVGLFKFTQVEAVLKDYSIAGAIYIRPLVVHVYVDGKYVSRWRHFELDSLLKGYGKYSRMAREMWLSTSLSQFKEDVGAAIVDEARWIRLTS